MIPCIAVAQKRAVNESQKGELLDGIDEVLK